MWNERIRCRLHSGLTINHYSVTVGINRFEATGKCIVRNLLVDTDYTVLFVQHKPMWLDLPFPTELAALSHAHRSRGVASQMVSQTRALSSFNI